MSLRPYQQACVNAVLGARDRGVKRMLVVMSTGLGKGWLAGQMPRLLGAKRTLVLAHRKELVDQLAQHLWRANPDATIAIEQATRTEMALGDEIVVGSIPTLAQPWRRRKFASWHPDLVMLDECHHIAAKSWRTVLGELGNGATVVGWTATPCRGDKWPLANVFDELVFDKSLRPANGEPSPIDEGWLCRARARRITTGTSIADVDLFGSDFHPEQLAARVNTDARNDRIYSAIADHAQGRRSVLVFTASVAHAEAVAEALRKVGETAACVTGKTEATERRRTLQGFADGTTRILCNVGVLTEGYDNPRIDCIVMSRPTKSPLLYCQMLGRGFRPCDGKDDLLVLDLVDVCGKHQLQTAATLFGMREVDAQGADLLHAAATCERAAKAGIAVSDGDDLAAVERKLRVRQEVVARATRITTVAQAIDLFDGTASAERLVPSLFSWVPAGADRYLLMLGKGERAELKRDALGIWRCSVDTKGGENVGAGAVPPWKAADRCVKRWAGTWVTPTGVTLPRWKLLSVDAPRWRKPVTPGTARNLRGWGVQALPPDLSEGAAQRLLATLQVQAESRMLGNARSRTIASQTVTGPAPNAS